MIYCACDEKDRRPIEGRRSAPDVGNMPGDTWAPRPTSGKVEPVASAEGPRRDHRQRGGNQADSGMSNGAKCQGRRTLPTAASCTRSTSFDLASAMAGSRTGASPQSRARRVSTTLSKQDYLSMAQNPVRPATKILSGPTAGLAMNGFWKSPACHKNNGSATKKAARRPLMLLT